MRRLRITSKPEQNRRRFFVCQAYTQSGGRCRTEATWSRVLHGDPTFLCDTHNSQHNAAGHRGAKATGSTRRPVAA